MDAIGEDLARRVASDGADLARDAGLDAEPLSLRGSGRVWRNILKVARKHDASLIVIGRRGISALELKILGSVANAVVHHADRPVLLVPERTTTPPEPAVRELATSKEH
jgi:nucleotide-binding universal stress UspA family protein